MTVNVTDTVGANNTIVLDSNSKIPAIDGSQVTALSATAFTTGSLATARIDVGTTAGKILQLDSNAKIPAISGANLTNAPGPTVSVSDPTISTNPTLGAKWINKTSGEVYICTDATAGANVWTNVGPGSGNVAPWAFGGTTHGWIYGGYSGGSRTYGIDQISFTTDGNCTDVGNMTLNRDDVSGCSSATHGYALGGYEAGLTRNIIDRAPFASGGTMTDVGDMVAKRKSHGAASSETYGYLAGGYLVTGEGGAGNYNEIWRFQMVASANAADVGDLTKIWGDNPAGCSDPANSYGYVAGGSALTDIERYAMASSASGADVGDLTVGAGWRTGHSSAAYGYAGASGPGGTFGPLNRIEKFAFASSSNATNIGNMTVAIYDATGVSSTTYGYIAGTTTVEKFSFTTDGGSTDVGDLTASITYLGSVGSQY